MFSVDNSYSYKIILNIYLKVLILNRFESPNEHLSSLNITPLMQYTTTPHSHYWISLNHWYCTYYCFPDTLTTFTKTFPLQITDTWPSAFFLLPLSHEIIIQDNFATESLASELRSPDRWNTLWSNWKAKDSSKLCPATNCISIRGTLKYSYW